MRFGYGVKGEFGEGLEEATRVGPIIIILNRSSYRTTEMDIRGGGNLEYDVRYTVGNIEVGKEGVRDF